MFYATNWLIPRDQGTKFIVDVIPRTALEPVLRHYAGIDDHDDAPEEDAGGIRFGDHRGLRVNPVLLFLLFILPFAPFCFVHFVLLLWPSAA